MKNDLKTILITEITENSRLSIVSQIGINDEMV